MFVFDVENASDGGSSSHIGDSGFAGDKTGDRNNFGAKRESSLGAFFVKFGV